MPEQRNARRIVTLVIVLAVALVGGAVAVIARAGASFGDLVDTYTLTNIVIGGGFVFSGSLIAWFRPTNAVGWLFLVCGIAHLVTPVTGLSAVYGASVGWPELSTRVLSTVFSVWLFGIGGLFPLALLLFPDGRLPSPRWRPLAWAIVVFSVFTFVTWVLADEGAAPGRATTSILSIGLVLPEPVAIASSLLGASFFVASIASLVVRFARGDDVVRRQLLWVILAVVAMLVLNSQRWLTGDGPILLLLSFALVPAAIAIAIVRHRLLDIRLVLSRTLLYVLAVSALIAVYAGIVAGSSLLVPAEADRGVAIAAAVVVAVGFNPLRVALQRVIDRAFYGSRADPAGTAARIGAELAGDDDLPDLIENARSALRLPYLALRRTGSDDQFEAGRREAEGRVAELGLVHRGVPVGSLIVGLRRGESVLHDDDRRTLELIASPLTIALQALALGEQVQAARVAVVEAREQERVRLQRDLHDGVGPVLTGIALTLDAASNLSDSDPVEARSLVDGVRQDVRGALDDVRRLVYGLRPIELDELGLVAALRQRIPAAVTVGDREIRFAIEASALPYLSPAVELAAFRIVTEAVSNVSRHSSATACSVDVRASDGALHVLVVNDGEVPRAWAPGVGVRSMSERAEELGGRAHAGPVDGSWRVEATLPIPAG
jgi:signal transduction histidine kinase